MALRKFTLAQPDKNETGKATVNLKDVTIATEGNNGNVYLWKSANNLICSITGISYDEFVKMWHDSE